MADPKETTIKATPPAASAPPSKTMGTRDAAQAASGVLAKPEKKTEEEKNKYDELLQKVFGKKVDFFGGSYKGVLNLFGIGNVLSGYAPYSGLIASNKIPELTQSIDQKSAAVKIDPSKFEDSFSDKMVTYGMDFHGNMTYLKDVPRDDLLGALKGGNPKAEIYVQRVESDQGTVAYFIHNQDGNGFVIGAGDFDVSSLPDEARKDFVSGVKDVPGPKPGGNKAPEQNQANQNVAGGANLANRTDGAPSVAASLDLGQ